MAINVTLEELLEAGAHFGHQSRRWNPRMAEYLYGEKDGVHIFDLAKTRQCLLEALEVISEAAKSGKAILFVGTKKQVKHIVADVAAKTGCMYINERWLGGTLTNFGQILVSVRKMAELKEKLSKGQFSDYTKKERLLIERKIQHMEKFIGGIAGINKLPDLMIIIDTHKEKGAVSEAARLGIPTVGIVDSNADPNDVIYPVPMNDDASKALEFIMDLFYKTIAQAKGMTTKPQSKETKAKKTKKVKIEAVDPDSEEEQLEEAHKPNKK